MDTNSKQNKSNKQNNTSAQNGANPLDKKDFFQLTKQQLSVNIEKYETVLKTPPVTIFNTQQIDDKKLQERPVVFQKRINSTDSAMLEESAYIALDDQELKLEKRIESYENSLSQINEKLVVAQTINDEKAIKELLSGKKLIERNLANLQQQYQQQNFETGLTSALTKAMNFPQKMKENLQKAFKSFLRRSKFLRKYTPLVKAMMVKDTLGKLDKINKSVDELVKMKVPFGEQEERYETLVNHLSRAGALHSQILKELNG